jgi:hypothetical protein
MGLRRTDSSEHRSDALCFITCNSVKYSSRDVEQVVHEKFA